MFQWSRDIMVMLAEPKFNKKISIIMGFYQVSLIFYLTIILFWVVGQTNSYYCQKENYQLNVQIKPDWKITNIWLLWIVQYGCSLGRPKIPK